MGDAPPLAEAPEIPGYVLHRLINHGGMGAVYEGTHETLNRPVAIKILHRDLVSDQSFIDRFLREARIAATLNHPRLITVYDAGQHAGVVYLAMSLVTGGDLADLLKKGPLPISKAVEIIIQCCEALTVIHQVGLVHRDLKPENILLNENSQPVITDLGLARKQTGDDRLTKTGQVLGTPAYMSPEQANGSTDLDARSDVYSLASTLFALVTGKPPFEGPTPWATVAAILNEPTPDPRTRNPQISLPIAEALRNGLQKNPGQRIQSCSEFAQTLQAALDGTPLVTRTTTTQNSLTSGVLKSQEHQRRFSPGVVIISGVSAILLVVVVVAIMLSGSSENPGDGPHSAAVQQALAKHSPPSPPPSRTQPGVNSIEAPALGTSTGSNNSLEIDVDGNIFNYIKPIEKALTERDYRDVSSKLKNGIGTISGSLSKGTAFTIEVKSNSNNGVTIRIKCPEWGYGNMAYQRLLHKDIAAPLAP